MKTVLDTQGPHSHIILMMEGCPKDFCGSEILAKRDFLGSMKDAGIFMGLEKHMQGFSWVLYYSSAQINNNISAIYCLYGIFLGRQILKL